MITLEQTHRLGVIVKDAALAGRDAIRTWGAAKQGAMAVEECGELLTAMARNVRGRSEDGEVVSEAADVIITAIQVALIHGGGSLDPLIDSLYAKTDRLRDRIAASPLAQKEAAGG